MTWRIVKLYLYPPVIRLVDHMPFSIQGSGVKPVISLGNSHQGMNFIYFERYDLNMFFWLFLNCFRHKHGDYEFSSMCFILDSLYIVYMCYPIRKL